MTRAIVPYVKFDIHWLQERQDEETSRSLRLHIAELSLKVFVSIRQIYSIVPSFSTRKIDIETFFVREDSDCLQFFEESPDFKILKTIIKVVESCQNKNFPAFLEIFSHYCDALTVYKTSLTQQVYKADVISNKKKISSEDREFFPWKMLSFFHHCREEIGKINFELLNYIEDKLKAGVFEDLDLLKNIALYEEFRRKVEYLEVEYYKVLVHSYFEKSIESSNNDPTGFRFLINCYEENMILEWKKTKTLSHTEIVENAEKVWENQAQNKDLKNQVLHSSQIQQIQVRLAELKAHQELVLREVKKLSDRSPTKRVALAVEFFYELINLQITQECARSLRESSYECPSPEAIVRFFIILDESLTIYLSDAILNIHRQRSLKLVKNRIGNIRNYFEHPEDYFLRMDKTSDVRVKVVRNLEARLFRELDPIFSLLNIRIKKMVKLISPHSSKTPEALYETLIGRASPPPQKPSQEEQDEKEGYMVEKFPCLVNFEARIIDKRDHHKKGEKEKFKVQPYLYDPHPKFLTFEAIFQKLKEAINVFREEIEKYDRSELESLLISNRAFLLEAERKISSCYRLFESLMDAIKGENMKSVIIESFECLFMALKDARNYQTHDLWRKDIQRVVNTMFLLCYDFPATIQSFKSTPCRKESLEAQLIQKIVFGSLKIEELEELVKGKKININAQDYKGRTLLHFLAEHPSESSFKMAEFLIKNEANIHLPDHRLMRPLHYACEAGFRRLVDLFLAKGATPDSRSLDRGTPLEIAQHHEYEAIAELLYSLTGATRQAHAQALLNAVKNLDLGRVQKLISKGFCPWLDFEGTLPLVELFRKESADPNIQLQIAHELVEAGASVDFQEPETMESCLHTAALYVRDFHVREYLLSLNPNVNLVDKQNETPLEKAVAVHNVEWVRTLLKADARLDIRSSLGFTPLLLACNSNRCPPEIVEMLLEHGANPNDQNEFGSVLHHAAECGYDESTRLLLKAGASPFSVGQSGLYSRAFPHEVAGSIKTKLRILEKAQAIFSRVFPFELYSQSDYQIPRYFIDDYSVSFALFRESEPASSAQLPDFQSKEIITIRDSDTQYYEQVAFLYQNFENLKEDGQRKPKDVENFINKIWSTWTEFHELTDLNGMFLYLLAQAQILLKASTQKSVIEGERIMGTFNQFSRFDRLGKQWPSGASSSSCTANALAFLSRALRAKTVTAWRGIDVPSKNFINQIVDEGRDYFEGIVKNRRGNFSSVVSEAPNEQSNLIQFGGDALHVSEVPDDQLKDIFSLSKKDVLPTKILTSDNPETETTVSLFNDLLRILTEQMKKEELNSLGAIIQCNGSSYALALLQSEEALEYAVFDSHGSLRLNERTEAYVYLTKDLEQAGSFLGNLIQFLNCDLGGLDQGVRKKIQSDYKELGYNQMAIYLFTRSSSDEE